MPRASRSALRQLLRHCIGGSRDCRERPAEAVLSDTLRPQSSAAESNALLQENMARRAAGEEPLPEEEPGLFKPLPEPSQLDNVLLANQMDA